MSRKYSPIGVSIWDSDKFLGLSNDSHRLGYLYLLACPHGNSVGVFRLPVRYLAADRRMTEDEAEAMLADTESVGLIERSDDTIRMVDWFVQESGANSPSTASGFCKAFRDVRSIRRSPQRTIALAEMLVATMVRAEAWNPTSKPFSQMIADFEILVAWEAKSDPENFHQALVREVSRQGADTVLNTMLKQTLDTVSDTMSHMTGVHHVPHREEHHGGHIERESDRDRNIDRDSESDRDSNSKRDTRASAEPLPETVAAAKKIGAVR